MCQTSVPVNSSENEGISPLPFLIFQWKSPSECVARRLGRCGVSFDKPVSCCFNPVPFRPWQEEHKLINNSLPMAMDSVDIVIGFSRFASFSGAIQLCAKHVDADNNNSRKILRLK